MKSFMQAADEIRGAGMSVAPESREESMIRFHRRREQELSDTVTSQAKTIMEQHRRIQGFRSALIAACAFAAVEFLIICMAAEWVK